MPSAIPIQIDPLQLEFQNPHLKINNKSINIERVQGSEGSRDKLIVQWFKEQSIWENKNYVHKGFGEQPKRYEDPKTFQGIGAQTPESGDFRIIKPLLTTFNEKDLI